MRREKSGEKYYSGFSIVCPEILKFSIFLDIFLSAVLDLFVMDIFL